MVKNIFPLIALSTILTLSSCSDDSNESVNVQEQTQTTASKTVISPSELEEFYVEFDFSQGQNERLNAVTELYNKFAPYFNDKYSTLNENEFLDYSISYDYQNNRIYISDVVLYDSEDIASPFFNNPDNQNTTMAVGDKFKATCVGGKKDGKSFTFTESKYETINEYNAGRLALLTDSCLEGGGCVNVCQLNVSTKKLSKN